MDGLVKKEGRRVVVVEEMEKEHIENEKVLIAGTSDQTALDQAGSRRERSQRHWKQEITVVDLGWSGA